MTMSIADDILARADLPTHLSSSEIRDAWSRQIREQAVFSARTTRESYVASLRKTLSRFVSGDLNAAKATELLRTQLEDLNYSPAGGFPGDTAVPPAEPGSLRDLSSRGRIKLILDTNESIADSLANLARASDPAVMDLQPGWKLIPGRFRRAPRSDWTDRWRAAGDSIGWQGASQSQFAALKSSPIWAALGAGAGGYNDALGNPYPPFAWGSGLTWIDLNREECASLGLIPQEAAA
jgi:hypothetical protein